MYGGKKVNIGKTKVMASGKACGEVERTGKWPCAVCRKGVGVNSIQCTMCAEWVHRKCGGVRGSPGARRTHHAPPSAFIGTSIFLLIM